MIKICRHQTESVQTFSVKVDSDTPEMTSIAAEKDTKKNSSGKNKLLLFELSIFVVKCYSNLKTIKPNIQFFLGNLSSNAFTLVLLATIVISLMNSL